MISITTWNIPLVCVDVLNVDSENAQTLHISPSDMERGYSKWQDNAHSATMGSNAQRDTWLVMPVLRNAIRSPSQVNTKVRVNILLPPPVHRKN